MEVILKKTKITHSILKQALRSTVIDLSVGEILGWCVLQKYGKHIVCYRSDIHGLSKYPMIKDIKVTPQYKDGPENKTYLVEVIFGDNYIPLTYTCSDDKDKDELIKTLKKAKHVAGVRGQFFL